MTNQQTALDTYLQCLPMILDKIEALRQLADDHFGHDPDAIHWGHVGDLGRFDRTLPSRRSCCRCVTSPVCGGSCFQQSSADWRNC